MHRNIPSRLVFERADNIPERFSIVCWIHNWPECPLEAIELRGVLMEMAGVKESP